MRNLRMILTAADAEVFAEEHKVFLRDLCVNLSDLCG